MRNMVILFTALLFFCVVYGTDAVPLSSFYEYSSSANVTFLPAEDDGHSSIIDLNTPFKFFGVGRTTAYVNTNGVVSFDQPEDRYSSEAFPINGTPLLTPFWGDVDIRPQGSGNISYQLTSDPELLSRAKDDVLGVYSTFTFFNPTELLIATWDHVAHFVDLFDDIDGLTNTFQCILITDGTYSFVIFLYADGLIQWSLGSASGVHAQAGFNAGVNGKEFTINGSQTEDILNITLTSNINIPGKYLFRVDSATISATPPPLTTTPPPDIDVSVIFVTEPVDVSLAVNAVTQIRCSAYTSSLHPNVTLTWINQTSNTGPSEEDGFLFYGETVEAGGIQFAVSVLSFSGSAVPASYSLACVAHVLTVNSSRPFTLSVLPDTATVTIDGQSEVALGGNLRISCRAVTLHFALIHFIHNGTILTNTDDGGVNVTTGTSWSHLSIYNIDQQNAGTYSCVVNTGNEGGTGVAELNVTVREELPAINYFAISVDNNEQQIRNETTAVLGSSVVITCNASGIPEPELTWEKDDDPVNLTLLSRLSSHDYYTVETLTIESVVSEDSGVFACIATNGGGSVRAHAQLHVVEPATIMITPSNTSVDINNTVLVTCVAYGNPPAEISWYMGATPLSNFSDNTVLIFSNQLIENGVIFTQSILQLCGVGVESEALYTCVASNYVNSTQSSFYLNVREPPIIVIQPSDTSAPYGSTVPLTCVATSKENEQLVSISWERNSEPVTNLTNYRVYEEVIEEGGVVFTTSVLELCDVSFDEEGEYSCVASDDVGTTSANFTLSVYTDVNIAIISDNTTVYDGATALFTCVATGTPDPTLTWQRYGYAVNETDRITVTQATEVIEGVTFVTSILQICDIGYEMDGGEYECVAEVPREYETASFYLTIQTQAPIFTIPPENLTIVNGTEVTLTCQVEGSPLPSITWERDGDPLPPDYFIAIDIKTANSTVYLGPVTESAVYSCLADNGVGTNRASATITVQYPLVVSESPANLTVLLGEIADFDCSFSGSPPPSDIRWFGNGDVLNSTRYTITPSDDSLSSRLSFNVSLADHNSQYFCEAFQTLVTGDVVSAVSDVATLTVNSPPVLSQNNSLPAVLNSTLILTFTISDALPPVMENGVIWTFQSRSAGPDSIPVEINSNTTERYQFTFPPGMVRLKVHPVIMEDEGNYTVNVSNTVGSDSYTLSVEVVVGAYITDPPNDTTVHVGLNATFRCVATSDPPHRVLWLFAGSALENGDKYVITDISEAVSELVVVNVSATDDGEYTCDVDNGHGVDMDMATLTVISIPVVTAVTQSPYIVLLNETAVLTFQVDNDIPPVSLMSSDWSVTYDQGEHAIAAENQRFTFSEDFTSLTIDPVHPSDEGTYTLTATNDAELTGSASIFLDIQSPSAIVSSPRNTTAVTSDSVSLSCTASGLPLPNITWYRAGGGEIVNGSAYTISSSSEDQLSMSVLTILAAALADTGQYNCTAANSFSTDSATFYIQVQEPPEISELVFTLGPGVVVGGKAQMQCTAFGVPAPDISWEAEGTASLVTTFNSTENTSTSTLTISPVSLSDGGLFTCTADNGVVSAVSSSLTLTVLVPPTVTTPFVNLDVVVEENVTLTCSASGVPLPLVTWTTPDAAKNQTIISSSAVNDSLIVSYLTISSVQQAHTGLYNCRAENSIDFDNSSTFLQVLEPAEIARHTDNTTATIADSVTLYCEGRGVHQPTVVWMRGNDIISNTSRVTISESVGSNESVISTLTIDMLRRSDAGIYSCSVSNSAGVDKASIELIIQEPALVVVYPEDAVLLAGDSVLLTCVGTGVPTPSLTWQMNGKDIAADSSKHSVTEGTVVVESNVFVRSSLLLCNASEVDIGEYSCSADNAVQEPIAENFTITVHTIAPVILLYSEDASAAIQSTVSLSCTAFGAPAPTVTWSFNGTELTTDNSRYIVQEKVVTIGALHLIQSVLHVCGISVLDVGDYTCSTGSTTTATVDLSIEVPVSIAVAPNDTSLYVGETAVLSCIASGLPLPAISWSRDDQSLRDPFLVTETEMVIGHVTFVRSTLHFCSAQLPDGGQYACVATNNLTTAEETFTLNINVEPQIVIFPNNSEFFAGSTLRLSCTAYGIPLPGIRWSRAGFDLEVVIATDSRLGTWEETVVVGGHMFVRSYLQICSTVETDSGLYNCTAVTTEREDGVEFGVTVVGVPPTLIQTPDDVAIVAEMGESLVASCIAYGSPAPTITWSLQPGSEGRASDSNNTSLTTTADSSILTNQFVMDGVGIVYSSLLLCPTHTSLLTTSLLSCSARNGVDGGEVIAHLFHVNVSVEPEVKDEPVYHGGFVGETISLACTADGVPLPNVTWLKDDCPLTQHIEQSNRFQISERVIMGIRPHVPEARESVLTLEDSRIRDTGAYSCRATNELNTAYLPVSHQVTVNALPVAVDVCSAATLCQHGGTCVSRGGSYSCICRDGWVGPQCGQGSEVLSHPVLLESPKTAFAQLLADVELECDVIGNPEPLITWYKDGFEIEGAAQRTLTLVEVDFLDRAAYHCMAQNSHGSITSDEAYLNIRGLVQYRVTVSGSTNGTDLPAVDKWLDVNIEETDIPFGDGTAATVLCIEPLFVQSPQGDWSVFLTLLSVDGEDLMLAQIMDEIVNIFARVDRELGVELKVEEITRYDGCPANVTKIPSNSTNGFDLELFWPEQAFGGLVELECPCDAVSLPLTASRQCVGSFEDGVKWAEPDDTQCYFSELTEMLCSLPNTDQLSVLTNNPGELGTLEVFLAAVNIKLATNKSSGNLLMSDNVLDAIDHLLLLPAEVLMSSQQQFNSTSLVMESLRQVIDNYPLPSTPPLKLFHESFSIFVDFDFDFKIFTGSSAEFSVSTTNSSDLGIVKRGNTATIDAINDDVTSSISLSNELAPILEGLQDPRIVFVMYTTLSPFVRHEDSVVNITLVLGSMVAIEARISGGTAVSDIKDVVTLVFSKNKVAMENGSISVCVFWNQTLDEGYMGWSEDGCRLVREDELTAVCTCDRLGIFSLLVDTSPIETQPSEDRDIGPYVYLGSVFSAVCLLVTITIILCTRSQWKTVTGIFLLNSCTSLLLLNLSFIAAYHSASFSESSCYGISVVLHYLFLASVFSLAGLAITRFRREGVKDKQRNFGRNCTVVLGLLITWCLPAGIAALSLGLSQTYSDSDAFCRPVEEAFHYGLILPWALTHLPIYLCQFLLPCPYCLNTLRKHVQRSWIREYTAIILTLALFDVGWGFGLPATHPLYIGNLRFYGQIVFTVANGCTGMVLLVFFGIMSGKVRNTCTVKLLLTSLKQKSVTNWQRDSGLYREDSGSEDKEDKEVMERNEETPVLNFQYDLNEVYGNPAVMTAEEEYAFESETQFS